MGAPRRISVLLADGHSQMKRAVERILGSDYVIQLVQSGDEIVELVEKQRPQLLVLDVVLQHMSGLEALKVLREKGELPPAVICSMIRDAPVLKTALQLGVSAYVYKARAPFDLKPAIEAALAGRQFVSPEISKPLEHDAAGP